MQRKTAILGSPPPMRGKVVIFKTRFVRSGITPAYAGKSACVRTAETAGTGSPPPMRGKALYTQSSRLSSGITPAYAGKSVTDAEDVTASEDHPRLCGEKLE